MLMKKKLFVYVALAVALAIGAARVNQSAAQSAAVPQIGAWGFDLTGVDPKAKPGDSFFDYANGAWDARTVIPPDKARFGSFNALSDKTEDQVYAIINDAAKSGASPATDVGKIGAILTRSWMKQGSSSATSRRSRMISTRSATPGPSLTSQP